jgi:hypothetical protein
MFSIFPSTINKGKSFEKENYVIISSLQEKDEWLNNNLKADSFSPETIRKITKIIFEK